MERKKKKNNGDNWDAAAGGSPQMEGGPELPSDLGKRSWGGTGTLAQIKELAVAFIAARQRTRHKA